MGKTNAAPDTKRFNKDSVLLMEPLKGCMRKERKVEEGCGKGLTPCVSRVTGSRFPPGQRMSKDDGRVSQS